MTKESLKSLLGISSFLFLGSKCSNLPPEWDVDIYTGDTTRGALVRCISPKEIDPCEEWDLIFPNDPRFDEMLAITIDDFAKRQKEIIDKCKKWED